MANITVHNPSSTMLPNSWGFQQANWHDSCIQKCIVNGKICAVLSITNDTASKICSDSSDSKENEGGHHTSFIKVQMQRVSTFCIFLLDKVIIENDFSWEDIMTLRFYVPTNLDMDLETLSLGLTSAFKELSEVGRRIEIGTEREPMFNIIPVLGAGKSAASTNDLITCELLAQKS